MRIPALISPHAAVGLLALLLSTAAGIPGAAQAAGETTAPRAEAVAPVPAGAPATPGGIDPLQEKFRKLQKEMASSGRSSGSATARSGVDGGEKPVESINAFTLGMQVIFGLIFVLILAVFTVRILKRMQGGIMSRPGQPGGDILEVLETCHLGPHQRIVALRMRGEVGVVGVTQQGMTLISMLKEPAEDLIRQKTGAGNTAAFSDNLNKLLERFKKPKRVSDMLEEA